MFSSKPEIYINSFRNISILVHLPMKRLRPALAPRTRLVLALTTTSIHLQLHRGQLTNHRPDLNDSSCFSHGQRGPRSLSLCQLPDDALHYVSAAGLHYRASIQQFASCCQCSRLRRSCVRRRGLVNSTSDAVQRMRMLGTNFFETTVIQGNAFHKCPQSSWECMRITACGKRKDLYDKVGPRRYKYPHGEAAVFRLSVLGQTCLEKVNKATNIERTTLSLRQYELYFLLLRDLLWETWQEGTGNAALPFYTSLLLWLFSSRSFIMHKRALWRMFMRRLQELILNSTSRQSRTLNLEI